MNELAVAVQSGQTLPEALIHELRGYLKDIAAVLGLPGATVSATTAQLPDAAIRITINDETSFVLGSVAGVEVIVTALHEYRQKWLSRGAAADVGGAIAPDAPLELFHQVANRLLHRGFALHHLRDVDWEQAGPAVEIAEAVISKQTARIALRGADYEGPLPSVVDWLWDELGLIVPEVRAEHGQDNVLLNDLHLPRDQTEWREQLVRTAAERYAGSLLTAQVADFLITRLADDFPQVVRATRERWSTAQLTSAFRVLLDRGLPITDLRAVLEALAEAFPSGPPDEHGSDVASAVQPFLGLTSLRRYIINGEVQVHRVDPLEAMSEATVVALHDELVRLTLPPGCLLLADPATAALVRPAIRPRFPELRVVTHADIPADVEVNTFGVLRL
ncbi:hypothetical protein PV646_21005 [Streptomyces sp. ID05-26A]|nr:hypothetical protein [Streptomyces sp. ID05-26A]